MPITNQASIEIDRAIHDVFDYTMNNVPDWSITVVEEQPLDAADNRSVGSRFGCVTESNGQRMEFTGKVLRDEPPTLSQVELVGPQFDIDVLYLFEDISGRTKVTQVSVVHPKHFMMKLLFMLAGKMMQSASCKAAEKELRSLKRKLESRDEN